MTRVDGGAPNGSVDFFDATTNQDPGSASAIAAGGTIALDAIGIEINKKGDASRFARPEPGKFTLR